MGTEAGFLTALLATVVFLGLAAVKGHQRQIRTHIALVGCALASLVVTIVFALRVGELYDLEAAGVITPIHLMIARVTTVVFLWPLITGPLLLRGWIKPRLHRIGAYLALGMTIAATVTGVMMLMGAERLSG